MARPSLHMFKSTDPSVEVGTLGTPIDFGICSAGSVTQLPYDLLLYNDKSGSVGSDDAYNLLIELLHMNVATSFVSDGTAGQTYNSPITPLQEVTVSIDGEVWVAVGSLSGYSSTARVYSLDLVTGELEFGDGVNGMIPPLGETVYIDLVPDTNLYGKTISENQWIGIKSNGVQAAVKSVSSEIGTLLTSTTVQIVHCPKINAVVGVWDNPGKTGTNYYTGGSYNELTGIITLGTEFTETTPYVEYSYTIADDAEIEYTKIGDGTQKNLGFRIPAQCAKRLQLQATVPADAETEGGVAIQIRLRVTFDA